MDTSDERFQGLLNTLNNLSIDSDYSYTTTTTIPTLTTADLSFGTVMPSTTGTTYTIGSTSGQIPTLPNTVWTTNNTSSVGGLWGASSMEVNQSGKVALKGEKADIDINGKSLVKWMETMEERMNWMQPNVELEKEWDDLKKLGDRYRKLEQKCREKAEMWKKLKSMPKPEIK